MPRLVERLYFETVLARLLEDVDRWGDGVTAPEQTYQRARSWCESVSPQYAHRFGLLMVVHLTMASDEHADNNTEAAKRVAREVFRGE